MPTIEIPAPPLNPYPLNDGDGRGPYRREPLASTQPRPAFRFEWEGYSPPANGWRYSREKMQKLQEDDHIHYPRHQGGTLDRTRRPALKRYRNEPQKV